MFPKDSIWNFNFYSLVCKLLLLNSYYFQNNSSIKIFCFHFILLLRDKQEEYWFTDLYWNQWTRQGTADVQMCSSKYPLNSFEYWICVSYLIYKKNAKNVLGLYWTNSWLCERSFQHGNLFDQKQELMYLWFRAIFGQGLLFEGLEYQRNENNRKEIVKIF